MTGHSGDLMSVLEFSAADLQANRLGLLSEAQAAVIRKDHRSYVLKAMALFFAFVIIATILIFIGQKMQNLITTAAGSGVTLVNALLIGFSGREYMRMGSDIRSGAVDALAGDVERVIRRSRKSDRYILRINDEEIFVTKEIFLCFEHERPYRIYRTRLAKLLLSAESVHDQTEKAKRAN